jgi:ferredoxin
MNRKTKIIIPVALVSSAVFVLFQVKNNLSDISTTNTSTISSYNQNQTDKNLVTVTLQKLSVLTNRCRGCGKCVRIDPSHFELSGGVAVVISSTNLNSSNLTLAINNCPAGAITLE